MPCPGSTTDTAYARKARSLWGAGLSSVRDGYSGGPM